MIRSVKDFGVPEFDQIRTIAELCQELSDVWEVRLCDLRQLLQGREEVTTAFLRSHVQLTGRIVPSMGRRILLAGGMRMILLPLSVGGGRRRRERPIDRKIFQIRFSRQCRRGSKDRIQGAGGGAQDAVVLQEELCVAETNRKSGSPDPQSFHDPCALQLSQ